MSEMISDLNFSIVPCDIKTIVPSMIEPLLAFDAMEGFENIKRRAASRIRREGV